MLSFQSTAHASSFPSNEKRLTDRNAVANYAVRTRPKRRVWLGPCWKPPVMRVPAMSRCLRRPYRPFIRTILRLYNPPRLCFLICQNCPDHFIIKKSIPCVFTVLSPFTHGSHIERPIPLYQPSIPKLSVVLRERATAPLPDKVVFSPKINRIPHPLPAQS
nr:hypothetical protein [Escherichia coli]